VRPTLMYTSVFCALYLPDPPLAFGWAMDENGNAYGIKLA
jgi:hypothetical protein